MVLSLRIIQPGLVRVGRIRYVNGQQVYPTYEGFTSIVVMTRSSQYGALGPYELRDEQGRIFENVWQFNKVYEQIPEAHEVYTQRCRIPVWDHPAETHVKDGNFTPEFWAWRHKGLTHNLPVRYPVGIRNRHTCRFAIPDTTVSPQPNGEGPVATNSVEHLDYVQSRKRTYLPEYIRLASQQPLFKELQQRHRSGENLLIIEMDGPCIESLYYYQAVYNVPDNFIDKDTIIASHDNMKIMLNDPIRAFGHGYCLAIGIQGFDLNTL